MAEKSGKTEIFLHHLIFASKKISINFNKFSLYFHFIRSPYFYIFSSKVTLFLTIIRFSFARNFLKLEIHEKLLKDCCFLRILFNPSTFSLLLSPKLFSSSFQQLWSGLELSLIEIAENTWVQIAMVMELNFPLILEQNVDWDEA